MINMDPTKKQGEAIDNIFQNKQDNIILYYCCGNYYSMLNVIYLTNYMQFVRKCYNI